MFVQQPGNVSSRDEHASLHVLLHRMPGQIRAGDETHPAVGDGHFGVDTPVGERIGLVTPGIKSCGGDHCSHLAYRIKGDAAAVVLRQLEQHGDDHSAIICRIQRLYDGRDVIGHEAGDEQGLLSGIDYLQQCLEL